MALQPDQILSHYRIIEKLGEGGMGEVYKARDQKLNRDVALKVLPSDHISNEHHRRRFMHEARAAAAVVHSNIATVHEIDETNGVLFIAMELVPGETLRHHLRHRTIPLSEAVDLATQIAEGLTQAHDAGIIHRDLKPENVIVGKDGHAKILDFGLAKTFEVKPAQASAATTATLALTVEKSLVGTVAYMSPEQARAESVDIRSDIFSFGTNLYEMVTGKLPFTGKTYLDQLTAIIHAQPKPASQINPKVSPSLNRIIVRCLKKDPGARYQSTSDLVQDLRQVNKVTGIELLSSRLLRSTKRKWPWLAGVFAVFSILSLLLYLSPLFFKPHSIQSIVVLPLENLSGDPNQEYFVDGVTDALTHELGRLGALSVISKKTAMHFKGSDKTLSEIARALNVDAVLEGSVVRTGSRVSITVRLIEAASDQQLWSDSFERNVRDFMILRNEIARTIAREIRIEMAPREEAHMGQARDVDPKAYDEYLRGRYALMNKWNREGMDEAIDHFDQAREHDSDFAPAYAGIAMAYSQILDPYPAAEVFAKAVPAAIRALELDNSLCEAYAALGSIKFHYESDWVGPDRDYNRALDCNPNDAWIHESYAFYLILIGRTNEGLAHARRALELDPLTTTTNLQLGWAYLMGRHYEEAIAQHQKTLSLLSESPNSTIEGIAHYHLALDYILAGRYEEALKKCEELELFYEIIWITYLTGKREEALLMFQARKNEDSFYMAQTYALFGEHDQAFTWLDKTLESRHTLMNWIKVSPFFDPLRSDPRYIDLLQRAGIPVS